MINLATGWTRAFVVAIALAGLAGCSGSSDPGNAGGSGPPPPPPPPPPANFQDRSQTIFTGETYDPSEVSADVDGKRLIRTRLIVYLSDDALAEEADDFLLRYNASITSSIAGSRSMAIRVPDPLTIDALDALITEMETEPFVDAVMKEYLPSPKVLPDNITEGSNLDYIYISHQLAVGGAAAWNAKEAITAEPNVLLFDFFGDGPGQLSNYVDANLSGSVASGASNPSRHGYHVAGILAGDFGGGDIEPDLVTGLIPGRINLFTADFMGAMSESDNTTLLLQTAASFEGTSVLSTSLGLDCACPNGSVLSTCNSAASANRWGVAWANKVRAAGVEDKLLHVTAASNREQWCADGTGYALRDAETASRYNAAALKLDLKEKDGTEVAPLENTLVVENLMRNEFVDFTETPVRVLCLNENSFVGGHIGGIGSKVTSLAVTGVATLSGTSMATPQVASLAAYLLAIKPELTPQRIKEILVDSSDYPGLDGSSDCSDFLTPAPAINAYSAVLALDEAAALQGSANDAPVRLAILDAADGSGNEGSNGSFDEHDLGFFITRLDAGTEEIESGSRPVKHSRVDLNGDGYDGGRSLTKRFNLDINYPPNYTTVTQQIEEELVSFDESALTDDDILCYYAYSGLYTGSTSERKTLMAPRCGRGTMAVYVSYSRAQVAALPGTAGVCPTTPGELFEERETISLRPSPTSQSPFEQRPAGHYWHPGDFDSEINLRSVSGARGYLINGDPFDPECLDVPFVTETEFNSTLRHDDNGNRLNVDVNSRALSECHPEPDGGLLVCSDASTRAEWLADFDYAFSTALNLRLVMQLQCAAESNRVIPDPAKPNPSSIGDTTISYSSLRFDHTGQRISTGPADFFTCNEAGVVNVNRVISLDAPTVAGTTDHLIIRVSAVQQVVTPFIAGVDEEQGAVTVDGHMTGFVEVLPGN